MDKTNDQKNTLVVKAIETYASDMTEAIEKNQSGIVHDIIHEEETKKEIENKKNSLGRNALFVLLGILFFLGGMFLLYRLIIRNDNDTSLPIKVSPSLIYLDKTEFKEIAGLNREKIQESLGVIAENAKLKENEMIGIYPIENKQAVNLKRFLGLLKSGLPNENREIFLDNFLIGASGKNEKEEKNGLFLMFSSASFADMFSSMKIWERNMLYDFNNFFGIPISPESNYLFKKNFEDGIVQNKNARLLLNEKNEIVLMYVFLDDSFVVIANSEHAIEQLILRLASGKINK